MRGYRLFVRSAEGKAHVEAPRSLHRHRVLRGEDVMDVSFSATELAAEYAVKGATVGLVNADDDVSLFRLIRPSRVLTVDDDRYVVLQTRAVWMELIEGIVRQAQAGGAPPLYEFGLTDVSPADVLADYILPGYEGYLVGGNAMIFEVGDVDASVAAQLIDVSFNRTNPLAALRQLEEAAGCEAQFRHNGLETTVSVDLLERIGATEGITEIRYLKNLQGFERVEDDAEIATRVRAWGDGALTLADARWTISEVPGQPQRWALSGFNPIFEDNAFAAAQPWWFRVLRTDTAYPITASSQAGAYIELDMSGLPALQDGDVGYFSADGATAADYIESPTGIDGYGLRMPAPDLATWEDIPDASNLIINAQFDDWTAGFPDNWFGVPAANPPGSFNIEFPTLAKETDRQYVRHGASAVRVTATVADQGVQSAEIAMPAADARRPYIGLRAGLTIIEGMVKVEIAHNDGEQLRLYPLKQTQHIVVDAESTYLDISSLAHEEPLADGVVQLRVTAFGGPAEFVLDAGMITTQAADEVPAFIAGPASELLWSRAAELLALSGLPKIEASVDVVDLHGIDPQAFRYDGLAVGDDVKIVDGALEERMRIVELDESSFIRDGLLGMEATAVQLAPGPTRRVNNPNRPRWATPRTTTVPTGARPAPSVLEYAARYNDLTDEVIISVLRGGPRTESHQLFTRLSEDDEWPAEPDATLGDRIGEFTGVPAADELFYRIVPLDARGVPGDAVEDVFRDPAMAAAIELSLDLIEETDTHRTYKITRGPAVDVIAEWAYEKVHPIIADPWPTEEDDPTGYIEADVEMVTYEKPPQGRYRLVQLVGINERVTRKSDPVRLVITPNQDPPDRIVFVKATIDHADGSAVMEAWTGPDTVSARTQQLTGPAPAFLPDDDVADTGTVRTVTDGYVTWSLPAGSIEPGHYVRGAIAPYSLAGGVGPGGVHDHGDIVRFEAERRRAPFSLSEADPPVELGGSAYASVRLDNGAGHPNVSVHVRSWQDTTPGAWLELDPDAADGSVHDWAVALRNGHQTGIEFEARGTVDGIPYTVQKFYGGFDAGRIPVLGIALHFTDEGEAYAQVTGSDFDLEGGVTHFWAWPSVDYPGDVAARTLLRTKASEAGRTPTSGTLGDRNAQPGERWIAAALGVGPDGDEADALAKDDGVFSLSKGATGSVAIVLDAAAGTASAATDGGPLTTDWKILARTDRYPLPAEVQAAAFIPGQNLTPDDVGNLLTGLETQNIVWLAALAYDANGNEAPGGLIFDKDRVGVVPVSLRKGAVTDNVDPASFGVVIDNPSLLPWTLYVRKRVGGAAYPSAYTLHTADNYDGGAELDESVATVEGHASQIEFMVLSQVNGVDVPFIVESPPMDLGFVANISGASIEFRGNRLWVIVGADSDTRTAGITIIGTSAAGVTPPSDPDLGTAAYDFSLSGTRGPAAIDTGLDYSVGTGFVKLRAIGKDGVQGLVVTVEWEKTEVEFLRIDTDTTTTATEVTITAESSKNSALGGHVQYRLPGGIWTADWDGDLSNESSETNSVSRPEHGASPSWVEFRAVDGSAASQAVRVEVPARVKPELLELSLMVIDDGTDDTYNVNWSVSDSVNNTDHTLLVELYRLGVLVSTRTFSPEALSGSYEATGAGDGVDDLHHCVAYLEWSVGGLLSSMQTRQDPAAV